MKRFYQTQLAKIIDQYDPQRSSLSLAIVLHLIQYFQYKNILELGFFEGLTFGMMLEATQDHSLLTAVDIEYKIDLYNQHYANSEFVKNKTVNLVTGSSLEFVPTVKYDFVNIDTGFGPDYANASRSQDLVNAFDWVGHNGIIMFDNYQLWDNPAKIAQLLESDTKGFVPFLSDTQALYFHHVSHDASNFLDNYLENNTGLDKVASLNNSNYNSYVVKEIKYKTIELDLYRCQEQHAGLINLVLDLKKV